MTPIYTLLPGLHGNSELYGPLVELLDQHPVECVSYPQEITQSYEQLSDWLINNLDWDKPRVIIAESFSGPLALMMAAEFPYSVQSLVLVASFCASPTNPNFALLPLRHLMMLRPPKAALRHFLLGESATATKLQELQAIISNIPARVLSERVRAILDLQASDCPMLNNTPILLLQASNDNLVPWETQNQLRMHYEHATTHWLEGPHLLLQTRPRQCYALISHFISTHTNATHYV